MNLGVKNKTKNIVVWITQKNRKTKKKNDNDVIARLFYKLFLQNILEPISTSIEQHRIH